MKGIIYQHIAVISFFCMVSHVCFAQNKDSSKVKYNSVIDVAPIELLSFENPSSYDIQFKKASTDWVESSLPELKRLLSYLLSTPNVKAEIINHLYIKGKSKCQTKKLSAKRAKVIYNYLVSNGIKNDRLEYKGLVLSHPTAGIPEEDNRVEIKTSTK